MKTFTLIGLLDVIASKHQCPEGEIFKKSVTETYCDGTEDRELIGTIKTQHLNKSKYILFFYRLQSFGKD